MSGGYHRTLDRCDLSTRVTLVFPFCLWFIVIFPIRRILCLPTSYVSQVKCGRSSLPNVHQETPPIAFVRVAFLIIARQVEVAEYLIHTSICT